LALLKIMDDMYNSGVTVSKNESFKPKIIDNLKEYKNKKDFLFERQNDQILNKIEYKNNWRKY
jgi:hypothetical protein